jgi:arylsulfatase A-like enzyme
MKRRTFLKSSALAGGAVATRGAAWAMGAVRAPARKPNIVYVLADQWRASTTGYAGIDPNIRTPQLDRLAGESVHFRNTVSVCPVCTPHRAALMTGRFPTSTGMILNDLYLPAEELCLPEVLNCAGYDTAYIGKWHLDGHGRDAFTPPERRQGWAYWKAIECRHSNYDNFYYTGDSPERRSWGAGYDAFAQTQDAQRYIRDHAAGERPFALMLSFGPPHPASSEPPDAFKALYDREALALPPNVPAEFHGQARQHLHRYYAHCSALDACVGRLERTIDEAGIAENTIFIFTSDHGGMLLSHGQPQEWKQVPWSESSQVPFLLRYPALHGSRSRVVETPFNTPDILPTLLGLCGVAVPETVEGEDCSRWVRTGDGPENRAALYMSVTPFVGQGRPYRAVRTRQFTYARDLDGPWLLYDDREDPWQTRNLVSVPEFEPVRQDLDARLRAEPAKVGDDFKPAAVYLQKWGYHVDARGAIPHAPHNIGPQSPRRSAPSQA